MQISKGNLLVAHGGGPTAVINSSLRGVIEEAKKYSQIEGIYGARFGAEGMLKDELIDLRGLSEDTVKMLSSTPASALGTCRYKLGDKDYPNIINFLKKHNIRYFFYNGGNDSMDTCEKIHSLTKKMGYEIKVAGIPKTIDNDLAITDHCPGFGSAARYAAVSTMELALDVAALPIHVVVLEIMGRNAGWLAASTALAQKAGICNQLIYLPERPFDKEQFLEDVGKLHGENKALLITVSEGLTDKDGAPLSYSGYVDGFGHKVPSGVASYISNLIMTELNIKSRSEKPGLLGRNSIAHQSDIDRDEAYGVGAYAVQAAAGGESGFMVALERVKAETYSSNYRLVPLGDVANIEKKFPLEWINQRGNGIEADFEDYCLPLMGGTLPQYARII